MGKTRLLRWGLSGLVILAALALLVHIPVKIAPSPPPEADEGPQPTAGPLAGLCVCVDPGHGGYDGGAYGRQTGTAEKELNLDVALRLAEALRGRGAAVILTRKEDTALADPGENRKRRDLQYRVDCAAEADVFLSIHMNEYRSAGESGPQVFYRAGAAESRLLAGALQQAMNAALAPEKPRAAHTGEYYLLEHLSIPAVLVECGFLSNPREEGLLLTADYRARVAESVCAGVEEYLRLRQNLANTP